jgi:CRISPR type IV-associated protein Csf2
VFETKQYQFLLEAESPISHAQETIGNESIVMRRKVRQKDGSFERVPIISSNTMRHGLREAAAYAFIDAAGLSEQLTRPAVRLLFNGGTLTGRGDAGAVSLDRYRQMVELCPPLALLGGCSDNRINSSQLDASDALLVCAESQAFVPTWAQELAGQLETSRAHVESVQRVRMDALLDHTKRKLLTSDEQVEITKQLTAGEQAHVKDDAIERSDSKSNMLPYTFETVVQGSLFFWSVTCRCTSDLDVDTLNTILATFLYNPVVGGKKGTGHGRLRVVHAKNVEVRRIADAAETIDTATLGERTGSLFRRHVAERKEAIIEWLKIVNS